MIARERQPTIHLLHAAPGPHRARTAHGSRQADLCGIISTDKAASHLLDQVWCCVSPHALWCILCARRPTFKAESVGVRIAYFTFVEKGLRAFEKEHLVVLVVFVHSVMSNSYMYTLPSRCIVPLSIGCSRGYQSCARIAVQLYTCTSAAVGLGVRQTLRLDDLHEDVGIYADNILLR